MEGNASDKPVDKPTQRFSIELPISLVHSLDDYAREHGGRSRSSLIREICDEWLKLQADARA